MECYLDRNYGADADGNRGIPRWEYTIDESDDEHILDHLKDLMKEFDPIVEAMPETVEIPFINPITEEDIILDINTESYLDKLRVYKLITNDNYQTAIDSLVQFDRALALKTSLYLIKKLSSNH